MKMSLANALQENYEIVGVTTTGAQVLVRANWQCDPRCPAFRVTIAGGSLAKSVDQCEDWGAPSICQISDTENYDNKRARQFCVSFGSGGGIPAREMGEVLVILSDYVDSVNMALASQYALCGAEWAAREKQWYAAQEDFNGRLKYAEVASAYGIEPKDGERVCVWDVGEHGFPRHVIYEAKGKSLHCPRLTHVSTKADYRACVAKAGGYFIEVATSKVTKVRAKAAEVSA